MAPETPKKDAAVPSAQEAYFFMHVLKHNKNVPDVDWEAVAQDAGLKNGGVARTRFGQMKKKLGFNASGPEPQSSGIVSPKKPAGVRKSAAPKGGRGRGKKKELNKAEDDLGIVSEGEHIKENDEEALGEFQVKIDPYDGHA